ncbi:hypothetical protein ES705_18808 [subsurface metagenome]
MGYIDLPNDNIPLVLIGDVFECLKKIPPETISCIVTSPPYWKHRDYYIKNQIGQEETAEEYIDKMANVSGELLRVLRKDGAYFLNIGDTYIDKGLQMIPQRLATKMIKNIKITALNKTKIGWLLRNQIIWYKPNHMPSPAKVRFTNTYEPICFFTRDDWERKVYFDIDSIRIPYKSDESIENNLGLPLTIGEREYKRWQPIIKKKTEGFKYKGKFKGHEVNVGASPGGRISITGIRYVKKREKELSQSLICDYLRDWLRKSKLSIKQIGAKFKRPHKVGHWFRKDSGGSLPTREDWIKLKKILGFDDKYDKEMIEMHYVLQTIKKHPKGKNPGDLWDWEDWPEESKKNWEKWIMKTAKLPYAHFSVFPEELPRRAIKSCCPSDGIVLDPFAGSGTTGKAAKDLNRKSILIEIQPKFLDIIKKRCGEIKVVYIRR